MVPLALQRGQNPHLRPAQDWAQTRGVAVENVNPTKPSITERLNGAMS